jgi:hypothetical protein
LNGIAVKRSNADEIETHPLEIFKPTATTIHKTERISFVACKCQGDRSPVGNHSFLLADATFDAATATPI